MPSCKEFALDDLMAITAIPVTDYNPATAAFQLKPTIAKDDFKPVYTHAITIGLQPSSETGTLIPIMRTTGKAKDDPGDATAGRLHKVTVTCQVDDRDPSVWDSLLALERTPAHLLLTFRDQSRAFVQATKDTYLCTVARDGAKTSVHFRIECMMGVQMMVP